MNRGISARAVHDSYSVRPSYKDTFCPLKVKERIKEIVEPILVEERYQEKNTIGQHTFDIADSVRNTLKGIISSRYKVMVQVFIGEKKGQGVRLGTKCFWDKDTDNMATYNFSNDSIFCVVIVYVTYAY